MVDTNKPLSLSDGTPVIFTKITSKGNIQVRVPNDHDLANTDDGGADPSLRIFKPDGTHFKGRTDLTLINVAGEAPAPVAANDATYVVNGIDFSNYGDARDEAIDLFRDGTDSVTIYKLVPVAVVGVTTLAA